MKVLTVGATGEFAGLVVPELKKRSITVRALIRDRKQEDKARERGADEVVLGDLLNAASLRTAAKGVDGVFHIGPGFAPRESEMGVAMVDAAKTAGVRRFVFSGVLHPSTMSMTNHKAKLPVEDALYHSGMNFTVLQPAMFMQNLRAAWKEIAQTHRFAQPWNTHGKAAYVDYRDVAEAAALAFSTDRLDYGTFELCAPGMLSRAEIAALMSEALGATVEAVQVPFNEWAEHAKIPAGPLRDGLKHMYADYDRYGFPGGNALALTAILQREPRSMESFLRDLVREEKTPAA